MEDNKTIKNVINQANQIKKNITSNTEYVAGIELLLTSDNNSTPKDVKISKQFSNIKDKIEELNNLTDQFISELSNEKRN